MDGFEVTIRDPPLTHTHLITFNLNEDFAQFSVNRSRQIDVMAGSAATAGPDPRMIMLGLRNGSGVRLELTQFALQDCAAISALRSAFSTQAARSRLGQVINDDVQVQPVGVCVEGATVGEPDDSISFVLANSDTESDLTNIIAPVAGAAALLLLIALLICFLHGRRRPERADLDDNHQRQVFRDRPPALLEDESTPPALRPGRPPVILSDEGTPPLRARTTSVRLAQIAEGDRDSIDSLNLGPRLPPAPGYHKPPPFHVAGSQQPKGPPPPYRRPPVYLSPT